MILWPITLVFFLLVQAGLGFSRAAVERPWLIPDMDLMLVILVGLYARRRRVTALVVLLAGSRAVFSGTPFAAALATFLFTGWLLSGSRKYFFRNTITGRLLFSLPAFILSRFLLAVLESTSRGIPFPSVDYWLIPALVTCLCGLIILPMLCYIPPLSMHVERSRV